MRVTSALAIFAFFASLVEGRLEFDIYKRDPIVETRSKRSVGAPWKNDSVVLYKFLNGEYYGHIGIGSHNQQFKVIFDTTWGDTWVPSSHCAWTEIVCQMHTQYDSSKSATYVPNGKFINLTSDELSLAGILSTDTFHLPHVKIVNQTFMEATHISLDPFLQYSSDGIVGLAFQGSSRFDNATPFFYNLIKQNVIETAMFTFYMNRDETTGKAGKIILGGTQRSHVKEETVTTLKVIDKSQWKVNIASIFAVQAKVPTDICKSNCKAIFDSSSNTILGPVDAIQKLNYLLKAVYLPGLKRYTVNCREYAKLPTVHFMLNDKEFVIQSKYYVQRLTVNNIEACFSPFVPHKDPKADYWELGGAFMMEFYTEFDMDNMVVNIGQTIF